MESESGEAPHSVVVTSQDSETGQLSLATIRAFSEEFAGLHLDDYRENLAKQGGTFSRKELNDSLWGTISLTPSEVALLDTPLIQRLGYIRQLGVAHWTYRGAVHTRIAHTLGAVHQVQTLVSAINVAAIDENEPALIGVKQVRVLRLAALLHDIGHGAFSHVSEKAIAQVANVSLVATDFGKTLRAEKRHLSEIVAYFVIRSAAMSRFLKAIWPGCSDLTPFGQGTDEVVAQLQDTLAKAITGQVIDNRIPLLHELISGPFDADKLDYYARDSLQAGTPSNLDISRLIQKITVRPFSREELPDKIAKGVKTSTQPYWLFGIKWSGLAVLDELHLTRVLLYSKIYHHAKIIAVEQMIQAFTAELAALVSPLEIVRFFYYTIDDRILHLTADDLARQLKLKQPLTSQQQDHASYAASILRAIRDRRLVVKAFQLQGRFPADNDQDPATRNGLQDMGADLRQPMRRPVLINKVLADVAKLLDVLGSDGPGARSIDQLRREVLFHMQSIESGGPQINRAYLMPGTGKPVPFQSTVVNKHGWADSYFSDQPHGYVFAPYELADIVYLAVERVLRVDYGVRLPTSASELSKRNYSKLERIKRILAERNAYKGVPYDIRPEPEPLRVAAAANAIDVCEVKFASYLEPSIEGNIQPKEGWTARTRNWLRQFERDSHVECALRLLGAMRMLGRNDTVEAVRSFVRTNKKFSGAMVVPLGDSKDSGAIQGYFANDLSHLEIAGVTSLEKLPNSKIKKVILIDDFTATGNQAIDILAAGFGQESMRVDLGETRQLFGDETQEFLRGCEIGFVFSAAWDAGLNAIRQRAKEFQLDTEVYGHIPEREIPFAFDGAVFEGIDDDDVQSFKARCAEIGQALALQILTARPGQSIAERAANCALGYGNRSMLLATPVNIPSQTLTSVWAAGKVDGVDWQPLLRRRKKN